MFKSKQVHHHYHLLRLFVEKLVCYQQVNFTIKNINSTRNIRDNKEAFQLITKPSLTFEECVNIYDSVEKQSITLISLMLTLCRKHNRPFESKRFIEELKKKINEGDQAIIIFENRNSRTLDIVLDNLMQVVGDASSSDEILHLVKKLHDSSLASLKSFRLDQLLKLASTSCNEFETSQRIFKILEERNDVSIFARNYHTLSALQYDFKLGFELLLEMHEKKYKVMDSVYLFTFKESIKIGKNQESMELCQMIQQSGTQNRVLVTSVMNFYNKCGKYEKAIEMAKQMKKESMDRVSYNCLIQSHIGKDDLNQVFSVLQDMEHNNINPDATTLTIILTACTNKNEFDKGLSLITSLSNDLIFSNSHLSSTIMNFYNKCGQFEKAIEISRHTNFIDTACYNCLIQSYIGNEDFDKAMSLVEEMKKKQIPPNATTFTILITECSEKQFFQIGQEIIDSLPQDLIFSNSYLISSIMNFYNKCGKYEKAIEITKQMKKGSMDVAIYNCLIHSYIGKGYLHKAIQLIEEMKQSCLNPSAVTFTVLITACANSNLFEEGKLIHQLALKSLRSITNELSTAIINFYTKCGHSEIAIEECEKLKLKGLMNIGSWNCLIQAHIQMNDIKKAIQEINTMKQSGISPNAVTFAILITACANSNLFEEGKLIHQLALKSLKIISSELSTSIINCYTKCGHSEIAIQECEKLKLKGLMSIGSWNSLIQAHLQNTKNTNNPFNSDFGLNKAMSLFQEMKESSNIKPDKITYLILMTGCGEYAAKTAGLNIVREIILEGMDAHEEIISVMIYFYSRIANHETAQQLFEDLVWELGKSQTVPSIITYNNMLKCYSLHGKAIQAKELFGEMIAKKVEPNDSTL